MVNLLKPRVPVPRDLLGEVHKALKAYLHQWTCHLMQMNGSPRYTRATLAALREALYEVNLVHIEFEDLLRDPSSSSDQILSVLRDAETRLRRRVEGLSPADLYRSVQAAPARKFLAQAYEQVLTGVYRIGSIAAMHATDSSKETGVTEVIISSARLYEFHVELMPPEQMMVVAGRRSNGRIIFDAAFNVTGSAGQTHVRADPEKLALASIAMDRSGNGLLGWVHSHPALGPGATIPSGIDRNQHADWLRHFSPDLVSIVVVRDGYVRFWGDAVESARVKVVIDGPGVVKEENDGNLYRLEG